MEVDSSVDNSEEETKAMSTSDKKLEYLRNPPMSLPRLDTFYRWELPQYADGEATDTNDEGHERDNESKERDTTLQVQHVDTLAYRSDTAHCAWHTHVCVHTRTHAHN
jgi:hypothetical protein